jgi:hypothetical protein
VTPEELKSLGLVLFEGLLTMTKEQIQAKLQTLGDATLTALEMLLAAERTRRDAARRGDL